MPLKEGIRSVLLDLLLSKLPDDAKYELRRGNDVDYRTVGINPLPYMMLINAPDR